jgi:hypothetical protein
MAKGQREFGEESNCFLAANRCLIPLTPEISLKFIILAATKGSTTAQGSVLW